MVAANRDARSEFEILKETERNLVEKIASGMPAALDMLQIAQDTLQYYVDGGKGGDVARGALMRMAQIAFVDKIRRDQG